MSLTGIRTTSSFMSTVPSPGRALSTISCTVSSMVFMTPRFGSCGTDDGRRQCGVEPAQRAGKSCAHPTCAVVDEHLVLAGLDAVERSRCDGVGRHLRRVDARGHVRVDVADVDGGDEGPLLV